MNRLPLSPGRYVQGAGAIKEIGLHTFVPTGFSSDAPCSALSVIYTDEGTSDRYLFLRKNPDCVDTLGASYEMASR